MKYRSRTEIIALILGAATNGATKTRLMYGAYVSYAQILEYLELLQENGLLSYEMGVQQHKLTEKGIRFLRSYEKISELIALPKTPAIAVKQPDRESSALNNW